MVRDLDAEARVLIGLGKRIGDKKANEKKKYIYIYMLMPAAGIEPATFRSSV